MTEASKKEPVETGIDDAAEFEAAFNATLEGKDYNASEVESKEAPVEEAAAESEETSEAGVVEPEGVSEAQAEQEQPEQSENEQGEQHAQTKQTAQSETGLPLDAFDEQAIKTLLAKSAKVDQLEELTARQAQELRRAFGKIGELNSHIRQLMKNPTQRGIKQAELRFERLESEYPELAEMLKEDLAAVLSVAQSAAESGEGQVQGAVQQSAHAVQPEQTAAAPEGSDTSGEVPPDVLAAHEAQIRAEYERKLLAMRHPDWEQVAQSPDFHIWLASQPPQVQQVARNSWSADELAAVFDLYKSETTAMAQKTQRAQQDDVRKKRLETAVPAPNNGSAAPPVADEVDDFLAGFESVMKQRIM